MHSTHRGPLSGRSRRVGTSRGGREMPASSGVWVQPLATRASGRQPAAPAWRRAAWGGAAPVPVQAPTTSAAASPLQPGFPGGSLTPKWTSQTCHTIHPGPGVYRFLLLQPPLGPNAILRILFTCVPCRRGPAEVCRCDIIEACE